MSARFYSPGNGTFSQLDTVMGSAQDPLSMNRFLYAHSNPATLIDPTGHMICEGDCDGTPTPAEIKATREAKVKTVKQQKHKQQPKQKQKQPDKRGDGNGVSRPTLLSVPTTYLSVTALQAVLLAILPSEGRGSELKPFAPSMSQGSSDRSR
jgi:hypothetical protein